MRYLVAWWVLSVVVVAMVLLDYLWLPSDEAWWSLDNLAFVGVAASLWLTPGFLLGGWKALLVAAGRSGIRTRTDKALVVVFAAWAVGWPLAMAVSMVRQGLV